MTEQWTLRVDRARCIGNGMCAAAAPEYFTVINGKGTPRKETAEPSEEIIDAFESCPQSAVIILDANGSEIEPE